MRKLSRDEHDKETNNGSSPKGNTERDIASSEELSSFIPSVRIRIQVIIKPIGIIPDSSDDTSSMRS